MPKAVASDSSSTLPRPISSSLVRASSRTEKRGLLLSFKLTGSRPFVRLAASSAVKSTAFDLPSPSSLTVELPTLLERALPTADEPYNAVLTASKLVVFPRAKGQGGMVEDERLDGGALYGPF